MSVPSSCVNKKKLKIVINNKNITKDVIKVGSKQKRTLSLSYNCNLWSSDSIRYSEQKLLQCRKWFMENFFCWFCMQNLSQEIKRIHVACMEIGRFYEIHNLIFFLEICWEATENFPSGESRVMIWGTNDRNNQTTNNSTWFAIHSSHWDYAS